MELESTMAEEKKNEYKYDDVVDVELDNKKIKEIIEIALVKIDKSWTIHDTKDEKISVAYKQMGDSNIYTVRGVMTMKTEDEDKLDGMNALDYYYRYQECGYNDIYERALKSEENTTEIGIKKFIDCDHQIVYSSNKSGYGWVIADRDFTYMRTRFKKDKDKDNDSAYTFENIKYDKIVGSLAYSVDDKHPFNVETKKDHVRARIIQSGYVLSQTEEQKGNKEMQVTYILAMDPCGMIPQWVVNQFAPSKGMEVKKFEKNWEKIKETTNARAKNNFKKDHKPLFAKEDK